MYILWNHWTALDSNIIVNINVIFERKFSNLNWWTLRNDLIFIGDWRYSVVLEKVTYVDVTKLHKVLVAIMTDVDVGRDIHVQEKYQLKNPPNFENDVFI